ncbi:MAG: hypothetical protein ACON5A_05095 [Candidatus Comchoanobacterales bacterium]
MKKIMALCVFVFLAGCSDQIAYDYGFTDEQWDNMSMMSRTYYRNAYMQYDQLYVKNAVKARPLSLKLLHGEATVWPQGHLSTLKSSTFITDPGHCKHWLLEGAKSSYVKMKVCDDGQNVWLDPKMGGSQQLGTIMIPRNQALHHLGFTYEPIYTTGYVGLSGAAITVKNYESEAIS